MSQRIFAREFGLHVAIQEEDVFITMRFRVCRIGEPGLNIKTLTFAIRPFRRQPPAHTAVDTLSYQRRADLSGLRIAV